jgi:hypothetical protein
MAQAAACVHVAQHCVARCLSAPAHTLSAFCSITQTTTHTSRAHAPNTGCTEETLKQVLYPLQLACASNMQVRYEPAWHRLQVDAVHDAGCVHADATNQHRR